MILSLLPSGSVNKVPTIKILHFDKFIHLSVYFLLSCILIFELFKNTKINIKSISIAIIIFVMLYGGLIEILQGVFTETRKADFIDFIANTIGSIIAVILFRTPIILSLLHRRI